MTAPVLAQVTTANGTGTSIGGTLPTLANGDVCVVWCASDVTRTWSGDTLVSTHGFTREADEFHTSTGGMLTIWSKRCTGAESGGSFTLTHSGSNRFALQAARITGAVASGTFMATATAAEGNDALPDPPTITPAGGAKDYLVIAIAGVDDQASNITSAPSGYSGLTYTEYNGTTGCGIAHAYKALSAAASDNPGTFGNASAQEWLAKTIAIYPLAAHSIVADNISSSPSVDNPALTRTAVLAGSAIGSSPSVGNPALTRTAVISGSSIASASFVGAPLLTPTSVISPSSIASSPSVDTPALTVHNVLAATAIASSPSVDTPALSYRSVLDASSIASSPSVGQPALSVQITLGAVSIAAAAYVGDPSLTEHIEVWPAELPQYFAIQGFRETPMNVAVDSPTDYGPGKRRPRYTGGWRHIQGVIHCTAEQAEALEAFYDINLDAGVVPFTWVDPITQAPATFRFRQPVMQLQLEEADHIAVTISLWKIA